MQAAQKLPPELQRLPETALEEYRRQAILAFNSQPELSNRLGVAASDLHAATVGLLGPSLAPSSTPRAPTPQPHPVDPLEAADLMLVFRHECKHLGCSDLRCTLCSQNQARRCTRNFGAKYLVGDALRATCTATICIEVVERATGRPAPAALLANVELELVLINARALDGLSGLSTVSDADLDRCCLPANPHGKPLLTATAVVGHSPRGFMQLPLRGSGAVLPELSATGSSEAMLLGQRPQFALLARAVDAATGARLPSIGPLVSEGFVVATPRVRTASKKEIPHVDDHVGKIAALGKATQAKLLDLRGAVADAGVDLPLPLSSVTRVGEFRELVMWAEESGARCDAVKRLLKLTKGWEEARDHAMRAVQDDSLLRVWFADDAYTRGLMFACEGGAPQLAAPLATVQRTTLDGGQSTLQATPLPPPGAAALPGDAADMHERAAASWLTAGHPGWALLQLDSEEFAQRTRHSNAPTLLPPHLATACMPAVLPSLAPSPEHGATADRPAWASVMTGGQPRAVTPLALAHLREHGRRPLSQPARATAPSPREGLMTDRRSHRAASPAAGAAANPHHQSLWASSLLPAHAGPTASLSLNAGPPPAPTEGLSWQALFASPAAMGAAAALEMGGLPSLESLKSLNAKELASFGSLGGGGAGGLPPSHPHLHAAEAPALGGGGGRMERFPSVPEATLLARLLSSFPSGMGGLLSSFDSTLMHGNAAAAGQPGVQGRQPGYDGSLGQTALDNLEQLLAGLQGNSGALDLPSFSSLPGMGHHGAGSADIDGNPLALADTLEAAALAEANAAAAAGEAGDPTHALLRGLSEVDAPWAKQLASLSKMEWQQLLAELPQQPQEAEQAQQTVSRDPSQQYSHKGPVSGSPGAPAAMTMQSGRHSYQTADGPPAMEQGGSGGVGSELSNRGGKRGAEGDPEGAKDGGEAGRQGKRQRELVEVDAR